MTTEAQRAAIAGIHELMAAVGVAASKLLLTERQYQVELVRWSEFPDKPLPNHDGVKNARYNFNSACAAVEAAAGALVEQRDAAKEQLQSTTGDYLAVRHKLDDLLREHPRVLAERDAARADAERLAVALEAMRTLFSGEILVAVCDDACEHHSCTALKLLRSALAAHDAAAKGAT